MKERTGAAFEALKDWYNQLGRPLETESQVRIRPVKPFFRLAFRHDLDRMDSVDLDRFLRLHQPQPEKSTCFVLMNQFQSWPDLVRDLDRAGHEVALHSEARPNMLMGHAQTTRLIEMHYRRRLISQRKEAERLSRLEMIGHAPHSINNFLPFDLGMTWEIIGQATIGSGLGYVSDWEAVSRVSSGQADFPLPLPPYIRLAGDRSKTGGAIVNLPTAWDDKFFFTSWADYHLRGKKDMFNDHTLDQAWQSLKAQAEACRAAGRPLVINLHPYWFTRKILPTWELKQKALDWAAEEGVEVVTLKELAYQAVNLVGARK